MTNKEIKITRFMANVGISCIIVVAVILFALMITGLVTIVEWVAYHSNM